MNVTGINISQRDFESWRKKQVFTDPVMASVAFCFGRNLPTWHQGGHRSPVFRKHMLEEAARLQAYAGRNG